MVDNNLGSILQHYEVPSKLSEVSQFDTSKTPLKLTKNEKKIRIAQDIIS